MSESIKNGNSPVAGNIARILEEKTMERAKIARKAGLKPRELTDIINNCKVVRACEIEALAEALGVEVQELFVREMDVEDSIL